MNEKRIDTRAFVMGKIIRKYSLPLDEVDELNNIYEKNKHNLQPFGSKLAGNIETELDVTNMLPTAKIIYTMYECMKDCVAENGKLLNTKDYDGLIFTSANAVRFLKLKNNDKKKTI